MPADGPLPHVVRVKSRIMADRLATAFISGDRKQAHEITETALLEGMAPVDFQKEVLDPAMLLVADYLEAMVPEDLAVSA